MWYGSAYYPEHWPEERWATDAPLMRAAGLNVVRIGEFAWCRMEPAVGEFDFAWMDRAIAVLNAQGIQVMVGTPTAGPPAWLVNADAPEEDCRQVYEDGVRMEFGTRSLCCVNHPRFRERSVRIAATLGEHFAGHPGVMGFQLDNELGMFGHRCYCPHCVRQFRQWLQNKYGTIAMLNQRLGMVFGGNEFRFFEDIPMPRRRQEMHNPGLRIDSARFFSDCNAAYLAAQAEAIRQAGARQPITHNVCPMSSGGTDLDYRRLFEALDVVGWDCYPAVFGNPPRKATMGLLHAIARGYKRAPYWVLEQQSGSPMASVSYDPRRIRLWTWQSVAHGAEMILYFRWRTCRFGEEQYWRGILDHDGRPNVRYRVVAETGAEIARLAETLPRLERVHEAAILLDYDCEASLSLVAPGGQLNYQGNAETFYSAISKTGRGCDIVFDGTHLARYTTVIAPLLRLMDPTLAGQLREFVAGGGTLVVNALTATLDRDHVAPEACPPWLLADVFGVERVEWSSLAELPAPPKERAGVSADIWRGLSTAGQVPVEAISGGPLEGVYVCSVWCDHLETISSTVSGDQGLEERSQTEVLARFAEGGPAGGHPALTCSRFGQGRALYVAGIMDNRFCEDLMRTLLPEKSPVRVSALSDIEIVPTRDADKEFYFVLNHGPEAGEVLLDGLWRDLLSGEEHRSRCALGPYDVCILTALPEMTASLETAA